MARRLICHPNEVERVLGEHEREWRLIAVLGRTAWKVVPYSLDEYGQSKMEQVEVRELYFEKRE